MNKALIIHSSKNGSNTNKIVEHISSNINIEVFNIVGENKKDLDLSGYNNVIFCSGIYNGEISSDISKWIENEYGSLNDKNIFFITSSAILSVDYYEPINEFLKGKNLILSDIFHCKGYSKDSPWDFSMQVGKEHPNSDDLNNALSFIEEKLNEKCI